MDPFVPVAVGALQSGVTRERLIRAIQQHLVRGEIRGGRWFVHREDATAWSGAGSEAAVA